MSGASVTVFTKVATPGEPTTLSKRISIGADGRVFSDGNACRMAEGIARTVSVPDAQTLAHVIGNLGSENALALGVSAHSECRVVTARALKQMSGRALKPVIARTREFIDYRHGPAWRQMSELTHQTSRSKVADGYRANGGSPKDRRARRDFIHGVNGRIHDLEHRIATVEDVWDRPSDPKRIPTAYLGLT